MQKNPSKPAVESAAAALRIIVLEAPDGAFIGSEDSILARLGYSRSTVRQVARLLEQEGVLRVKRGIGGGYYAARPNAQTIERAVSSYLETLEMDAEDVTVIASVLWIEVVRRAAQVRTPHAAELADRFKQRVDSIKPGAAFAAVRTIEVESRKAVFDLVQSPYIELIFDINMAFATRRFPPNDVLSDTEENRSFVHSWKDAKLLELAGIAQGNVELAVMAARYVRAVWHNRIWMTRTGERPSDESMFRKADILVASNGAN